MEKNKIITSPDFSDAEIEKCIAEYWVSTTAVVKEYALQDGKENLPRNKGHWQARVYNYIAGRAKSMIDVMQQRLLPVSKAEARKTIETVAEHKIRQLTAENVEVKIRAAVCKEQLKALNTPVLKVWGYYFVICLSVMFGCFDGFMTYDAIQNAGLGERQACMYSIVIAIAIVVGSHFGASWALRAVKMKARIFRGAVQVILFAMLFYWLGEMRANYINNDLDIGTENIKSIGGQVSGIVIGGISSFIYFFALCFSMFAHLSQGDKEQCRIYRKKSKELQGLQSTIQKYEGEIRRIEVEAQAELNHINAVCEYAVVQKRRIIDIARECLSLYANTNLNYRRDGLCPDFFSNPPQFNL